MKKFFYILLALIIATLAVSAFSSFEADDAEGDAIWSQDYIDQVEPIMMRDPYLEMFGQAEGPIPYSYAEAVKLSGHSCGATSGAWVIARKALEALYPDGEYPVRGNILVETPGAEDEWNIGVFGEVITYITGAAPKTGFVGAEFGKANEVFVRRDKMIYAEEPVGTAPPLMQWIFTRADTGESVSVNFNLMLVQPPVSEERVAMGKKMATNQATAEEAAEYIQYWNDRVIFIFENADSLEGLFTVTVLE